MERLGSKLEVLDFDLTGPFEWDLEALQFLKAFSCSLVGFKFEGQRRKCEEDEDYVDAEWLSAAQVVHEEAGRVEDRLVLEVALDA